MTDCTDLEPGIYRLTEDCPAHAPDKRKRDDWRAAPMQAGMLFAIRNWRGYVDIAKLHSYSHESIRLDEALFLGKLVRVTEPTARQYLLFRHGRGSYPGAAVAILDRLMADGLLTIKAIDRMLAEDDAEAEADEAST